MTNPLLGGMLETLQGTLEEVMFTDNCTIYRRRTGDALSDGRGGELEEFDNGTQAPCMIDTETKRGGENLRDGVEISLESQYIYIPVRFQVSQKDQIELSLPGNPNARFEIVEIMAHTQDLDQMLSCTRVIY